MDTISTYDGLLFGRKRKEYEQVQHNHQQIKKKIKTKTQHTTIQIVGLLLQRNNMSDYFE